MSGTNKISAVSQSANRFDFLRLLFASGVFVFHAVVLANIWPGTSLESGLARFAELSIQGFFVISGALVYGSLQKSIGVRDYFNKRVRRLYPAYAAIILIPALISLLISGQFAPVLKYVGANLVFLNFLEPNLPELFEGHRHSAVNGALWTLKIEVMFYLTLPILGWMLTKAGKLKWALLAAIYIGAELWRGLIPGLEIPYATQIARQLPGQMSFFVVGMVLWILRDKAQEHAGSLGLVGIVLLMGSFFPTLEFIRPLALGALVAGIAYTPGISLNAARFGDISYGVYITHFPIINGLIALGLFAANSWLGFALSGILVIISSLILWRFVERPFLRQNSHYRRAEKEAA
jgi:peptidoglycan/LPS O-acetylase OafA/YrhL